MAYIESQDTALYVADTGGSPTWLEVKQVVNIQGPSGQAGEIDVTHLKSTAREFIQALADFGSVSLELEYDPINDGTGQAGEGHEVLRAAYAARTEKQFRIGLEDTDATKSAANTREAFVFNGFVTEFSMDFSIDSVVKVSCTLRTTGGVTRTTY